MKKLIIRLVEKLHLSIFGHPLGVEMKSFLGNLSWSFLTGIIIMPVVFLITTLAGRFMGPEQYGKYSLLLVINQFLLIFIFFGLDITTIKSIAKAKSFNERKEIISTSSVFVSLMLILLAVLALVFYPIINKFNHETSNFILLVIGFTVVVSIKITLDLIIRGLESFRTQAIGKSIETGILATLFILVFILYKKTDLVGFVFVVCFSALAIIFYYLTQISKYLGRGSKEILFKQLKEGRLFFSSTLLGTVFLSMDKLIIARYLDIKTLGVYSAYYFASFTLISQAAQLVTNVFLPASARVENKVFANKIDKLFIYGFLPLAVLMSGVIFVMLLFFGKDCQMNIFYVAGFAVFSAIYFFQALYSTVILDATRDEYKKYLMIANGGINVGTLFFYGIAIFFHFISIPFIIVLLIINAISILILQRLFIKRMQLSAQVEFEGKR